VIVYERDKEKNENSFSEEGEHMYIQKTHARRTAQGVSGEGRRPSQSIVT